MSFSTQLHTRKPYRLLIVLGLLTVLLLPTLTPQVKAKEMVGATSPAWSPDGKRIAFVLMQENQSLYIVNADGSVPFRLTENVNSPIWSPDGKRIAFTTYKKTSQNVDFPEVDMINADGSGQARIADGYSPAWSPDGKQISYQWSDMLYVADANGSNARHLVGDSALPVWWYWWSPDWKHVAFSSWGATAEITQLYIVNADGTGLHKLLENGNAFLAWSPDGTQIVVSGRCGSLVDDNLCITNADGSGLHRLPANHGQAPTWSPDGKQIAFTLNGNPCFINPDGTHQHCLTPQPTNDWFSGWSPDGKQILLSRMHLPKTNTGEPYIFYSDIYVMNADGSNAHRLPSGIETL